MNIKKTLIAGASASMLIASPIAAQADRASAPAEDSEQVFGGSFLISALIVAAVVVGIVLIADDDDEPVSP
ncbi:MAG: hypothetical protein COW16_13020 [Sphingomonadales bacterium CG12_big_fil_rev_8_21_14_0_65_65_10]|jgi:hypothetical protein|uniref:Ferrochelatase n=1 Tax=Blastomonas marina TaxID=1867408 RepID=A0ABQ1FFT5_9SPHN|nr:hypothetical protein [Blastomonas marina]PIW54152.1 MAG: hypothetical protein COW16_13020 [Sphingomonadales bacterium CG12_big_fil_rev_8_21_14_0_65_65_10]WPZ02821.1 hypothetical protein T8S45_08155 [Blastomonas marina]GGA08474.1 hypothetical protein GCM10010923_18390 [Blastomonas marina]